MNLTRAKWFGVCADCGKEDTLYFTVNRWVCEVCLDLALETI